MSGIVVLLLRVRDRRRQLEGLALSLPFDSALSLRVDRLVLIEEALAGLILRHIDDRQAAA